MRLRVVLCGTCGGPAPSIEGAPVSPPLPCPPPCMVGSGTAEGVWGVGGLLRGVGLAALSWFVM